MGIPLGSVTDQTFVWGDNHCIPFSDKVQGSTFVEAGELLRAMMISGDVCPEQGGNRDVLDEKVVEARNICGSGIGTSCCAHTTRAERTTEAYENISRHVNEPEDQMIVCSSGSSACSAKPWLLTSPSRVTG